MKRRKDSGFTLIELMIVIAVIGILAIVLVPKIGTIKTQAKESGLDSNIRVVQGYCESKINKWVSKSTTSGTVQAEIATAFRGDKSLVNPITSVDSNATSGGADASSQSDPSVYVLTTNNGLAPTTGTDHLKGSVVVAVEGAGPITGINIYSYDSAGAFLSEKEVNIEP